VILVEPTVRLAIGVLGGEPWQRRHALVFLGYYMDEMRKCGFQDLMEPGPYLPPHPPVKDSCCRVLQKSPYRFWYSSHSPKRKRYIRSSVETLAQIISLSVLSCRLPPRSHQGRSRPAHRRHLRSPRKPPPLALHPDGPASSSTLRTPRVGLLCSGLALHPDELPQAPPSVRTWPNSSAPPHGDELLLRRPPPSLCPLGLCRPPSSPAAGCGWGRASGTV
jgi:hypothetical protein